MLYEEYLIKGGIDCLRGDYLKLREILRLLPEGCADALTKLDYDAIEEIRLRINKRPTALYKGRERELSEIPVRSGDLRRCIELATDYSAHSFAGEMAEGFIYSRGVRIGICGSAVVQNGVFSGFSSYSSLDLRLNRQIPGICDDIYRELRKRELQSVLIISPPGCGKTTALRELIRLYSNGGVRVCVADERYELSGEGYELGKCTDVLSGLDKRSAASMLLRGMNPQIIAMDEISAVRDCETIRLIEGCGVALLATAHAGSRDELYQRKAYRELIEDGAFEYMVIIKNENGRRSYILEKVRA